MSKPTERAGGTVTLKVIVVDDHPIVRKGLVELINTEADMTVCADSDGGGDLVGLVRQHRPNVVVLDLSLGTSHGLDLTRALLASDTDVRVLILSMHDEVLFADRALRAGASGYIMKREAVRELLTAIRRVSRGDLYVSPQMAERIVAANAGRLGPAAPVSPLERLTDRERQIFELIGRGLGTSEIASRLYVAIKTVETHRAHIKEKLGLKTGTELVRSAISWIESV